MLALRARTSRLFKTSSIASVQFVNIRNQSTTIETKRGRGGRVSVAGQTVTVFGAYGQLGRYVCAELAKVGTQLVIPHRPGEMKWRHLRPMGDVGQIVFVPQDFRNVQVEELEKFVQYSDTVINLIGKEVTTRSFSLSKVNVEIAGKIAEACANQDVKRLIHISSASADVNSSCNFFRTKAQGELLVKEKFPNATIIRPTLLYSAEDDWVRGICAQMHKRIFPTCHLDAIKMPVYAHDVAKGIKVCHEDPSTLGNTYQFNGPDALSNSDIVEFLQWLTFKRPRKVQIPPKLMKQFCDFVEKYSFYDPLVYGDLFTKWSMNEKSSDLPGLEDLGIEPKAFKEESIRLYRYLRPPEHLDDVVYQDQVTPTKDFMAT